MKTKKLLPGDKAIAPGTVNTVPQKAMFPISQDRLDAIMAEMGIRGITTATIRQICSLAKGLEAEGDDKFVHLELGNPGIPAQRIGIDAEIEALNDGVACTYPAIMGIPALKEAGSQFIKAFLGIDIPPKCVIPTVGSMQGSFTIMLLLGRRCQGKDTMLFINPGFPAQRHQAKVLGLKTESFDIYDYRGDKLRSKLESILAKGHITGIIYSNPNNPAWINLTDSELRTIGELATKYDAIVVEDLAYLGMDFRTDYSKPFCEPFIPSVARYTDNYILLISGSKIFSYAGQRIATLCMSEAVYNRRYPELEAFYGMTTFGDCYVFGVLYGASSGTAHSAQIALAHMMKAAADGQINFIDDCREYGRRGKRVIKAFEDNGFRLVYDKDGDSRISDGFFFTAAYKDLDSGELQKELLRYGIATISLPSTGSLQSGIRVCVSMMTDEDAFDRLEKRLYQFHNDH